MPDTCTGRDLLGKSCGVDTPALACGARESGYDAGLDTLTAFLKGSPLLSIDDK
ncbi:MAG TPA: hypothetical protein VK206_28495 [Anaerolineales bacterium]|nr:hypothetical protein [Anaerolineales bacterium]